MVEDGGDGDGGVDFADKNKNPTLAYYHTTILLYRYTIRLIFRSRPRIGKNNGKSPHARNISMEKADGFPHRRQRIAKINGKYLHKRTNMKDKTDDSY